MSVIKFHKVPEVFPNRKVRTVRTEQLWVEPFPLHVKNGMTTATSPVRPFTALNL